MQYTRQREYEYRNAAPSHTEKYLWPIVERQIQKVVDAGSLPKTAFDLGCGNGAFLQRLTQLGYEVAGVDVLQSGVTIARSSNPGARVELGSAYDDLQAKFGQFSVVVSLEVVEHLYAPRDYAKTVYDLLQLGGAAVISTPFHGYWKNLLLAVTGKMDKHFTALWDHGHIKFWSPATLKLLLLEAGFKRIEF